MFKRLEWAEKFFGFKFSSKTMNKVNMITIILFMISMLLPTFLYEITKLPIYDITFKYIYLILIFPLFYTFIYNVLNNKIKKVDIFLLSIYLVIVLISSVFSRNPYISIIGGPRKDGFITLLFYYLLYVNSKSLTKENIKIVLKATFIIGIINALYGIIESFLPINIISLKSFDHMAYGLIGNPNFYGAYMLMLALLSIAIYLFKDNKKIYLVMFFIFYISIILASSSGPFITFIFMMMVLLIIIMLKKKIKVNNYLKILLLVIIIYFPINYGNIYINKNIYKFDTSKNNMIGETFTGFKNGILNNNLLEKIDYISNGRVSLWNDTFKYIDYNDALLLGVGPDNFRIYHLGISDGKVVGLFYHDKAHNIYLNILVETGIFSLIVYIAWIFIYHKKVIKSKNLLSYIFLFALIGYNIQGLFNINVVHVMLYYYIFAGIAVGQGERSEKRIN